MKFFARAALCALPMLVGAAASATSVSFNASVSPQSTNWTESLVFPKFDPSLGTLLSIDFMITGTVSGVAQFENLDAAPATITVNLAAQIKLQRPDLSNLVVVLPIASNTESVSAFDGIADYGGTSGRTYSTLNASVSDSATSSSPADIALFTATFLGETISLQASALGLSSGNGAGNLQLLFQTIAGADATVRYNYEIPTPGAVALFGLAGLAVARRRR